MQELLIEAESLKNKGGWLVDSASMETLHSAYLMAHGMGVPVADAYDTVEFSCDGSYCIWALTRDWTATWEIADPAGKFEILLDGEPLPQTLGTNGKEWSWQLAGMRFLSKGVHTLALHDLTGFNGRCDAIYITDSEACPDSSRDSVDLLRRRLNWKEIRNAKKQYDLVVVGGGIAGVCTALAALRRGCRVALINDRPVLGGCNSSEVRVCMGGQIGHAPYERIGDVVREIAPVMGYPKIYKEEYFEDARKLFAFEATCCEDDSCEVDILLNESVLELEQEGNRISSVICTNTHSGEKTRVSGRLFSDCSGDGILARLAGAEVMYGNDAKSEFGEKLAPSMHKNRVMGHSIRWYSEERNVPSTFPDLDWRLPFDDASCLHCYSGDWEQETGFDRDMVREIEYIRDYGLRAIYANWSYQKNRCREREKFANWRLKWVSACGGKRESYRVKGDYILTQRDFEREIDYPDATAKITWGIDLHYPEPTNAERFGEAFRSFAYHLGIPFACPVPYRCLYSKDIDNLFLGGRLISASHVAFSAIRVMRTLGMLGEVVGIAASICKQHLCDPRDIYLGHLEELKAEMKKGVEIPAAFACGGIDDRESYHFKDIGWWRLKNGVCTDRLHQPREPERSEIEKFRYCVESLGIEHQYPMPEKWELK